MTTHTQIWMEAIAALPVAGILVLSGLTDLRERRIPNVLPTALVGIWGVLTAARLIAGAGLWAALLSPALTAAVVFAVTAMLFARGALGGGDVKLLSALALFAGAEAILAVLIIMGLTGGLLALAVIIGCRMGALKDQRVPYGIAIGMAGLPLCAGPWVALAA